MTDSGPSRLFNRNFLLLWQGTAVSLLGTQVFRIAMVLWIRDATGSAAIMGLLLAVASTPGVLLGPFAGTFADRRSRRAIIVTTDIIDGVAVLAVAAVLYLWPDNVDLVLSAMFARALVAGVSRSFFSPAATAALPDLVPLRSLAGANAWLQMTSQTINFIGQFAAGFLYRYVSIVVLFVFNALTFLISAFSESFMSIPRVRDDVRLAPQKAGTVQTALVGGPEGAVPLPADMRTADPKTFLHSTGEGFRYLWECKGLRELVLASAILAFFSVWIVTLLPFYVPRVLGLGDEWYGILLATFAAGSLVGAIAGGLNRMSRARTGDLVVGLFVTVSLGYVVLGLVSTLWIVLVLAFIGGAVSGFNGVTIGTIVQASIPSEIRGRVFGIIGMISGSLAPVGMGLSGIVADLVDLNIGLVYIGCGSAMFVISALLALNPHFRRFVRGGYPAEPRRGEGPE